MTTKMKLTHIAAQLDQLKRELDALAQPVCEGGAVDISFWASHELGRVTFTLGLQARTLMKLAQPLEG